MVLEPPSPGYDETVQTMTRQKIIVEYKTKSGKVKRKEKYLTPAGIKKNYGKLPRKKTETGEAVYGKKFKRETTYGKVTRAPTTENIKNYVRDDKGVYHKYNAKKVIEVKLRSPITGEVTHNLESMEMLKHGYTLRRGVWERKSGEVVIPEQKLTSKNFNDLQYNIPERNFQLRGTITYKFKQDTFDNSGNLVAPAGQTITIEVYSKTQGQNTNFTIEAMYESALKFGSFVMFRDYNMPSDESKAMIESVDLQLVRRVPNPYK